MEGIAYPVAKSGVVAIEVPPKSVINRVLLCRRRQSSEEIAAHGEAPVESLLIRTMSPDDQLREVEFCDSLSLETKYMRFFSPRRVLTPQEIYNFTHVNYTRDFALVAVDNHDSFVCVARYMTSLEGSADSVEVAIVVGENHRRMGLADYMIGYLLRIASHNKKKKAHAEVMIENARAKRLFESFEKYYPMTIRQTPSSYIYIYDLTQPKQIVNY